MQLTPQDTDNWAIPIVRQYFQTAASGYPYINCPDELRPATALFDNWWVIYAPNYDGGVIVEGYLIEQWRERQRKLLVLWSILGLFVFYFSVFSGSLLIVAIALVIWLALVPIASWFASKFIFAKREWVLFPVELKDALCNGAAVVAEHQAEESRKQALPDAIGQITGKIGGAVMEAVAGKAAGRLSEVALERAFKSLAEQMLGKQ